MKFGSVTNPGEIDFTLPADHPDTSTVLGIRVPKLSAPMWDALNGTGRI